MIRNRKSRATVVATVRNQNGCNRGQALRHHVYRLLVVRSQADPILSLKEICHRLGAPRAPRTIKRYVEEVRRGWRPKK